MNVWVNVVAGAAGVTVLAVAWQRVVIPGWKTMRTTVQVVAALLDIATEYPSENGSSLGKTIRSIEQTGRETNEKVDGMVNKLDTFILDRKPNGKRHTDPQL